MSKSSETSYRDLQEMSFREASVELENIVRSLEGGDLELEEAIERYSRGAEILKELRERLANAEQKVQILLDNTQVASE